jgi:hypothetical protein
MWHSGTKFPNKPVKEQSVSKCYNEQQEKSVYFAGINSYMIASESLTAFKAFLIIAALDRACALSFRIVKVIKKLCRFCTQSDFMHVTAKTT